MVNAAAIVYVFLDDAEKAASMVDVKEWLQIIDEVVEIKLQYDATSKRTCFSVEFRKPTSAQQAVQYLNGSRFKNCLVTIRSRVFSAVEADGAKSTTTTSASEASSSSPLTHAGASAGAYATRKRCRATAALPHNHELPEDLQMDQLLVEQLDDATQTDGSAEVVELWTTLKVAQEKLVNTYADLKTTAAELSAADAQLAKLLHASLSTSADGFVHSNGGCTAANEGDATVATNAELLAAHRCVSHQRGIPIDVYTPQSVISLVTSSFGPISFCSVSANQREFFLVLKFVFRADEERFFATTNSVDGDGGKQSVHNSSDHVNSVKPTAWSEKEKALFRLQWANVDFTITPRDFPSLAPAELDRQKTARELLLRS